MKLTLTSITILIAVALIAVAGYLGFRSAANEGELDLGAELDTLLRSVGLRETRPDVENPTQAPPTVPVTLGDVTQTVLAPGQLVGTQEVVLDMDVGGRLAQVHVRPGDVVRQGQPLARLEAAPFENALREARLKLALAQAEHARQLAAREMEVALARSRLELAQADHPRQLAEAELGLADATSRLAQARYEYPSLTAAQVRLDNAAQAVQDAEIEYRESLERHQNWGEAAEPQRRVDAYARALEAARDEQTLAQDAYQAVLGSQASSSEHLTQLEAAVERARIALERLQDGVDPLLKLELTRAERELADLRAAGVDPTLQLGVEKAEADLKAAVLFAPFDGVVLEVKATFGETISPGVGLIVLSDPAAVEARVTVIEEDLPLVEIGQRVDLFFDARPEAASGGHVARVVPQRLRDQDRPLYAVFIALDDPQPGIVPGMTVDASIVISEQPDVLRLPRALVRAGAGDTTQVKVWTGEGVETREVQLGLRGDVYVEIVDGLREGEQVVAQ